MRSRGFDLRLHAGVAQPGPALRLLLLTSYASFVGCTNPERGTRASLVTRDSAGITITESIGSRTGERGLSVHAEPRLTLGVIEGSPEREFFQVTGAVTLGSGGGRIAVANAGTREIRFFNQDGTLLHSVGGHGEGPGEFGFISFFGRYRGDSLAVWDAPLGRITLLGPEGQLEGTYRGPLLQDQLYTRMLGVFDDGTLLGALTEGLRRETVTAGVQEITELYFRFWPRDGRVETLGEFYAGQTHVTITDGSMEVITAPLTPRPTVHVAGSHFWYGSGLRFEVEQHSHDGALTKLIRIDNTPTPVTPDVIRSFMEWRLPEPDGSGRRARAVQRFANVAFPTTLPAYDELRVDAGGNLWVKLYEVTAPENEAARWIVLDPQGRVVSTLEMPSNVTVFEIGQDFVLGTLRGAADVEAVVVLEVRKEPM